MASNMATTSIRILKPNVSQDQALRKFSSIGLGTLYRRIRVGPLRRALMREGVTPRAAQPRLMRGEAL